jgi:pimeloyl-ACP methyl ester carboxylesterase
MSIRSKSTIVRAVRAVQIKLIRTIFRTLELAAPGLAARWATRIWCTPPHVRRNREPAITAGERFLVPVTTRGMVVAETWGTGPVTTYLLHGWGGRRGHLAQFVAPLVAAGQRVVALDGPGHGESGGGQLGGRRTTPSEMAGALAAVISVTGPAHAIVAHSGGGAAVAVAVQDGHIATGRLVLISPMASPMPYLRAFADQLCLGRRSFGRLVRRVEQVVDRGMADFDVPARAAAAEPGTLPPLLVIHDRADRMVMYADGQAIAGAWPGASLHTTQGLGHLRLLSEPSVVETAVSFVTTPAPDLIQATAAGSTPRS